MSSILGGVLIPDEKRCVSSVNGNLGCSISFPGGMFVSGNKSKNKVAFNHFHISLARAHLGVLKPTAQ